MRKNRNKYQLSRAALNKRIADLTCNNFRLLSEKEQLIKQKEELTQSNEYQTKESKNIKKIMKLNTLIMLLMMDFLNCCNELENGWGFKRVISTYLAGIAQEMHQFPGDLNPASYDPYNSTMDNDEVIDLDDYEDSEVGQVYED